MGAGVSGQPVYLTRSTMLISHTPMTQAPVPQCTFRRQSTVISAPGSSSGGGISSQLALPIQFYPNNVYQNNGYSAQVHGFEPTPHTNTLNTVTSASAPPPPQPSEETPPTYSSIYPDLAHRTI